MLGGLTKIAQYRAILARNKKYDGIFYFAVKNTGVYCRPSCPAARQARQNCIFFESVHEAVDKGYVACKRCHPSRLKNGLSLEILDNIETGAINDKGVHGLADSLHISDRHLRRLVHDRTGISPVQLNKFKRLGTARWLVIQTKLPIIDIAFIAEFSSLRQFNDVFRSAFKASPSEVRKAVWHTPNNTSRRSVVSPLALSYTALKRYDSAIN
jgi:AraC family transcriptional regulator of adaptative response / DNA-3-methyladenine glycosylase II